MNRLIRIGIAAAGIALAAAAVLLSQRDGFAQPVRQSFDIMTGAVSGSHFPLAELIARVVSHPPGLARCEKPGVCGPAGMIVSARSSEGAVANVLAVNSGAAASGLAQGNVVADAVAGRGPFRKAGRQTHIRVMADLFPETMQLVVASRSPIRKVGDLTGKRVSLGSAGSGGEVIASAVLSTYGIRKVRRVHEGYESSAAMLRRGEIDGVFLLGGSPSPVVADLVARGAARLVPIDGETRKRLIARVKGLSPETISAGVYRGTGAVETVRCHTLWIAKDSAPPEAVYQLVRALYNPANRAMLASGPRPAQEIRLGETASLMSVPLHAGAARYYREVGQIPAVRATQARGR